MGYGPEFPGERRKRPRLKSKLLLSKRARKYLVGPKVFDSLDKEFGKTPRNKLTWTSRW